MSRHHFAAALIGVLLASFSASDARAQQLNRVFVSQRQGDDKARCGDIDKPCATFSFAATRALAGGRVMVLDSGEYGPVTITKSLTIEAPEGVFALISRPTASPWSAVEVDAGANDVVTLRGITMSSNPVMGVWGVRLTSGRVLHVERCTFDGFQMGVEVFPFSGEHDVFVSGSVFRGNGDGVRFVQAGTALIRGTVDRCTLERNYVGIGIHDGANVSIRNCTIAGNITSGIDVGSSVANFTEFDVEGCLISGSDTAVAFDNANTRGRMSNTTVIRNRVGLSVCCTGDELLSRGNNTVEGNTIDGSFTGAIPAK
ncbi:MAG: right-handed parallel beta-helix repeat-containing protein [Thermoanaerobaculia bacterium]